MADLIAFANSKNGGALLLGVAEDKGSKDQTPKIVGCNLGDKERLVITNRSRECCPPVEIQLFRENVRYKPFVRVEIPSSRHRPHCTKQGLYMTRIDGQNAALQPAALLEIFLQVQGQRFFENFRSATMELRGIITDFRGQVDRRVVDLHNMSIDMHNTIKSDLMSIDFAVDSLSSTVGNVNAELGDKVEEVSGHISSVLEGLTSEVEDSLGRSIHNIDRDVERISSAVKHLPAGVDALLGFYGLDPAELLHWRPIIRTWLEVTQRLSARHPEGIDVKEMAKIMIESMPGCNPAIVKKVCEEILGPLE